jgi:hypothetical protein
MLVLDSSIVDVALPSISFDPDIVARRMADQHPTHRGPSPVLRRRRRA